MKLNLGAADRRIEGFISVDIAPPADQVVDLAGPWPWPDSSVDQVLAYDVIEHIPDRRFEMLAIDKSYSAQNLINTVKSMLQLQHSIGRIHFMNELHRVLKPGARATIETPDASRGVGYFQDPTHVSPWCRSTFKYFEHGAFAHTRLAKSYGIMAAFRIVDMVDLPVTPGEGFGEQVFKIRAVLECVKNG